MSQLNIRRKNRKRGFTRVVQTPSGGTKVMTTDKDGKEWQNIKNKLTRADAHAVPVNTPENSYWKSNAKICMLDFVSNPPKYGNPESLWEGVREYFLWCENWPRESLFVTASQGDVLKEAVPKARVPTKKGLCIWLGINIETWNRMFHLGPDYARIVEAAEYMIETEKYELAAAGLVNATMISHDLRLNRDGEGVNGGSDHRGKGRLPKGLDPKNLTTKELIQLDKLLSKASSNKEE